MSENSSGDQQQDKRSGNDRRQFTFTLHIPERRNGSDRRNSDGKEKKSTTAIPKDAPQKDDSEPI